MTGTTKELRLLQFPIARTSRTLNTPVFRSEERESRSGRCKSAGHMFRPGQQFTGLRTKGASPTNR